MAFGQRRKTLRAALKTWAGSPAAAEALLDAAGVESTARGEALGIEEFVRLGRALLDLRACGVLAARVDPRTGKSVGSSPIDQATSTTALGADDRAEPAGAQQQDSADA